MPSDAKKREQQRKKEAAKLRAAGKKGQNNARAEDQSKEQSPAPEKLTNGNSTNGSGPTDLSAEGESHYEITSYRNVM